MCVWSGGGKRRRITGLILVIRAPSICLSMQVFSHALFVADSIIAFLFFIKGPLFFKWWCIELSNERPTHVDAYIVHRVLGLKYLNGNIIAITGSTIRSSKIGILFGCRIVVKCMTCLCVLWIARYKEWRKFCIMTCLPIYYVPSIILRSSKKLMLLQIRMDTPLFDEWEDYV